MESTTFIWRECLCGSKDCLRIVRVRLEGRSKCLLATWSRMLDVVEENEGPDPRVRSTYPRGTRVSVPRTPPVDDEEWEEVVSDDDPW